MKMATIIRGFTALKTAASGAVTAQAGTCVLAVRRP